LGYLMGLGRGRTELEGYVRGSAPAKEVTIDGEI
jgi:hypothetical protein